MGEGQEAYGDALCEEHRFPKKHQMTDKEKKLIKYITQNAQSESALLYPHPSFYVFTDPLLDAISEIFDIDKKEISRCVDDTLSESKRTTEDGSRTKNQVPH